MTDDMYSNERHYADDREFRDKVIASLERIETKLNDQADLVNKHDEKIDEHELLVSSHEQFISGTKSVLAKGAYGLLLGVGSLIGIYIKKMWWHR